MATSDSNSLTALLNAISSELQVPGLQSGVLSSGASTGLDPGFFMGGNAAQPGGNSTMSIANPMLPTGTTSPNLGTTNTPFGSLATVSNPNMLNFSSILQSLGLPGGEANGINAAYQNLSRQTEANGNFQHLAVPSQFAKDGYPFVGPRFQGNVPGYTYDPWKDDYFPTPGNPNNPSKGSVQGYAQAQGLTQAPPSYLDNLLGLTGGALGVGAAGALVNSLFGTGGGGKTGGSSGGSGGSSLIGGLLNSLFSSGTGSTTSGSVGGDLSISDVSDIADALGY